MPITSSNVIGGITSPQTLVVPLDGEKTYTALKNEFLQNPNVVSVAGSRNHIGRSSTTSVIGLDGKKHEVDEIEVGYNYLKALGIRLKEGNTGFIWECNTSYHCVKAQG